MVILPYDFRIDMAIERGISGVVINRLMIGKGMSYDECLEKSMSPVQKDVFIIVDEWWKELGVLKKQKGSGRTIRPVYINFRTLELKYLY